MHEHSPSEDRIWGKQFSLRTLMIVVTIICVLFTLFMIPPLLAITCGLLYVTLSGLLAVGILYGHGWVRAFSLGAVLPYVSGYLFAPRTSSSEELAFAALAIIFMTCISGTASAAFHGCLTRQKGMLPIPNLPFIRNWFTNGS